MSDATANIPTGSTVVANAVTQPTPAPAAPSLWRCNNEACADKRPRLGHDFANADGKCPKCGISPADGALGERMIVKRLVIHFEPPGPAEGVGARFLACHPEIKAEDLFKFRRTADPAAVTCPACIDSHLHATVSTTMNQKQPDYSTIAADCCG